MRVIKFSSESRNYPIVTAKPCLFEDWIIHLLTFFYQGIMQIVTTRFMTLVFNINLKVTIKSF